MMSEERVLVSPLCIPSAQSSLKEAGLPGGVTDQGLRALGAQDQVADTRETWGIRGWAGRSGTSQPGSWRLGEDSGL